MLYLIALSDCPEPSRFEWPASRGGVTVGRRLTRSVLSDELAVELFNYWH
jgi:hypothetical protein